MIMSDHVHAHDHSHDPIEVADTLGPYQLLAEAVRELLIEKGVMTADEIRRAVERMDARSPDLGARMVARAWVDPDYKARMLSNGSAAAEELGIAVDGTRLVVVENTDDIHNVIVCTLCSCYPRTILGLPPDWYKSRNYRSRTVREPRTVLAEFGTEVAGDVELRVHDSTADMRYLVLPARPADTEGWSEERLARLVTRDSMIGVARPLTPAQLAAEDA
jgi:nitrile hydratase